MHPRRIVPGQVWFVTRRCFQGRYLLRPDAVVNQIVLYAMALAAQETNIRIFAVVQMSNHWHLLLEDVEGRLSEFLQKAHWLIARAVNRVRGRTDCFFEAGSTHCQPVETLEDALRIAAYIEANPVKSGLVRRSREWPGVSSVDLKEGRNVDVPRPKVYFAEDGDEPEWVTFQLSPFPTFGSGLTSKHLRTRIRRRVRCLEKKAAATHGSVLGVKRIRSQDPEGRPDEPPMPKPVLWSCVPEVAKRLKERELAFRRAYQESRRRWIQDKSVRLPFGTYWLRVFAGARCEEAPPDYRVA